MSSVRFTNDQLSTTTFPTQNAAYHWGGWCKVNSAGYNIVGADTSLFAYGRSNTPIEGMIFVIPHDSDRIECGIYANDFAVLDFQTFITGGNTGWFAWIFQYSGSGTVYTLRWRFENQTTWNSISLDCGAAFVNGQSIHIADDQYNEPAADCNHKGVWCAAGTLSDAAAYTASVNARQGITPVATPLHWLDLDSATNCEVNGGSAGNWTIGGAPATDSSEPVETDATATITVAPKAAGFPDSPRPRLIAGVPAAAVVQLTRLVNQPRQPTVAELAPRQRIFAGSDYDPGVVSGGIVGNFLPDEAPPPRAPRTFAGVPPVNVPPPAIVKAPPMVEVVATGRAVQMSGAGAAPTVARIYQDAPFGPPVFEVPTFIRQRVIAGAGQAAQVATTVQARRVFEPQAIGSTSWNVGVAPPPVQAAAVILQAAAVVLVLLPPRPSTASGFGQPAQVAVTIKQPLVPAFAELPPVPRAITGAGQAAQVAVVEAGFVLPVLPAPGFGRVIAGAGQAPQVAAVVQARVEPSFARLPPATELPVGVPPVLPTAGQVYRAPVDPLAAVWAPGPSRFQGFGQAAQVTVVVRAIVEPPATSLPPTDELLAGVPPVIPTSGTVTRAPAVAPAVVTAPPPSLARGTGQAPQVAVIITAADARTLVLLPPAPVTRPGFNAPDLTFAGIVGAPVVLTPVWAPGPAVLAGAGQASGVLSVTAAPRFLPVVEPGTARLAEGVPPPPPVAQVFVQPPVWLAALPPVPVIQAGAGLAFPQVAVVVQQPVVAPVVVSIPLVQKLFAGFGEPPYVPPLMPATPADTFPVDFDSYEFDVTPWQTQHTMIGSRLMDPDAVRTFTIDWARWPFPPGTRIASIAWTVPIAFEVVEQSVFGTKANIKVRPTAAAQPLTDYVIACRMTTNEQSAAPARDVRRIGVQLRPR